MHLCCVIFANFMNACNSIEEKCRIIVQLWFYKLLKFWWLTVDLLFQFLMLMLIALFESFNYFEQGICVLVYFQMLMFEPTL